MAEPYVEAEDVAKFFAVTVTTVRAWTRKGWITPNAYLYLGNMYRYNIPKVVEDLHAAQARDWAVQEEEANDPQMSLFDKTSS